MKLLLYAYCLFLPLMILGQSKKLPGTHENLYWQTSLPYLQPEFGSGKISYIRITLLQRDANGPDTESVQMRKYDSAGQLMQEADYIYTTQKAAEFDDERLHISQLSNGTKADYIYNTAKHTTRTIHYTSIPVRSIGGIEKINTLFLEKIQAESALNVNSKMGDIAIERHKFFDSVLHSDAPDFYNLNSVRVWVCDKNDNPVYEEDTMGHFCYSYTYTYTAAGQLAGQYELFKFYSSDGLLKRYSAKKHLFTYDARGRLLNIKNYSARSDSVVDTVYDKDMEHVFHYNVAGNVDTILYIGQRVKIMHVLAYSGKRMSRYTIFNITGTRVDTVAQYLYTYDGDDLIQSLHVAGGNNAHHIRQVCMYNKLHLPIDIRRYDSIQNRPTSLYKQELFFYGNKDADSVTALRSLYVARGNRSNVGYVPAAAGVDTPALSKEAIGDGFTYVDQMPEFNGDLNSYIAKNLQIPAATSEENRTGSRIVLHFMVTKAGSLADITVVRSVSKNLDAAAIKMLENMPKWKPGIKNGKAVDVYYTLPVIIDLTDR